MTRFIWILILILHFFVICCTSKDNEVQFDSCTENINLVMCVYNKGDIEGGYFPYAGFYLLVNNPNDTILNLKKFRYHHLKENDIETLFVAKRKFKIDIPPHDSALVRLSESYRQHDTSTYETPIILIINESDTCQVKIHDDYEVFNVRNGIPNNHYFHMIPY